MKVLVVIPTQGKRPQWLAEAVESVYGQTMRVSELAIEGDERNMSERLNGAIDRSDCDAFLILCDDDKLDPMFIQKTAEAMEREGVDIVYTNCHIFGNRNCQGAALGKWTKENLERNTVPLVTSLCKKSAWAKAGGFRDVKFFDWDFWKRCYAAGVTAFWLKEPLFWYRDHAEQHSKVLA